MSANAEKYPELLADLAAQIGQYLVDKAEFDPEKAAEIGFETAEHVRRHWGGGSAYFPKGVAYELSKRDYAIWSEFNGRNVTMLAKQYQLTEMRIYQIVKAVQREEVAKRQRSLL